MKAALVVMRLPSGPRAVRVVAPRCRHRAARTARALQRAGYPAHAIRAALGVAPDRLVGLLALLDLWQGLFSAAEPHDGSPA